MTHTDRDTLRSLAARWMELAQQPVMAERKRCWTALKDLRAERPMVLFEAGSLEDFLGEDGLRCQDEGLRAVERVMRMMLRHVEEIGDDTVLNPYWGVQWQITSSSYGVAVASHHATDSQGGSQGYSYTHPIATPDDLDKLQPRTWTVDREGAQRFRDRLAELFGDLLPVTIEGPQCIYPGLTADLFRLMGNDNLLLWAYDEPEALHRAMAYLRDDRLTQYAWMEQEGLLTSNVESGYVGSGSPGYTTALRQPDASPARLQDLWVWMESQETTMVSPDLFAEFFLPYLADVAQRFGLVYYGCCEPLHDRWPLIREAMPHVRAVSISPWSDLQQMADYLGRDYVFSRKPAPTAMSGAAPDWETLERDIDNTLAAAQGCNLEIVFRDVYRINGDRPRLRQWVDMVRARIGGAVTV